MKGFAYIKDQNGVHLQRLLNIKMKKELQLLLCAFSVFPLIWYLLLLIYLPLYLSHLRLPR